MHDPLPPELEAAAIALCEHLGQMLTASIEANLALNNLDLCRDCFLLTFSSAMAAYAGWHERGNFQSDEDWKTYMLDRFNTQLELHINAPSDDSSGHPRATHAGPRRTQ